MKIKHISLYLTSALITLNASAFTFSNDFQSDTPGQLPATPPFFNNYGTVFVVDGTTTTPSDPFGPEGNQSLLIWNDAVDETPRVTWAFGETVTNGILTFDAYVPSGAFGTWRMYLYEGTTSNLRVSLGANTTTQLVVSDGAGSGTVSDFPQADTVFHYRVEFSNGEYSLWINEVAISIAGETVFDLRNGSNVDRLLFLSGANASTNTQLFIDNVSFTSIPEPSHYALFVGVLGLGLIFWRRLRR